MLPHPFRAAFAGTIALFLCLALPPDAGASDVDALRAQLADAAAIADADAVLDAGRALLRDRLEDPADARAVALAYLRLPPDEAPEHALETLAALERAIALAPASDLLAARGLFVLSVPWGRVAFADLARAATAPDAGPDVLAALVDAAGSRADLDVAEARLTERIARNPEDAAALRARAEIRYVLDEPRAALGDLGALDRIGAFGPGDMLLSYRLNLARGDLPSALGDLDRLVAVSPDDVATRRLRAAMLIRLGRLDEAERDLAAAAHAPGASN